MSHPDPLFDIENALPDDFYRDDIDELRGREVEYDDINIDDFEDFDSDEFEGDDF